MDKNILVSLLCELSDGVPTGAKEFSNFCENKSQEIQSKLNCSNNDINTAFQNIIDLYFSDQLNPQWKYTLINLYIFKSLGLLLGSSENEILSVQQSKNLKNCLSSIMNHCVYARIEPNIPFHVHIDLEKTDDIFLNYNILKCTTYTMVEFMSTLELRMLILPEYLKGLLAAIYQIVFCPLKKPDNNSQLTKEIYQKLQSEKALFTKVLKKIQETVHPVIYIRETMVLFQQNAPVWFKKAVSQTLTNIMLSENGISNIIRAMFDETTNDSTKNWKTLDVITKLILSCQKLPNFRENTCQQVFDLLSDTQKENCVIFEKVFVCCTKRFFTEDQQLCTITFVNKILNFFKLFTYKGHRFKEDISNDLLQNVRLVYGLFVETSVEFSNLSVVILKPVLNVLFRFYCITLNSAFKSTNNELKETLVKYISHNTDELFTILDSFLFGINHADILEFRSDIVLNIQGDIIFLKNSEHSITYSITENSEALLMLLKDQTYLMVKLFSYLLHCLTHREKYFNKANEDLMKLENKFMTEFFEKSLVVHRLLSDIIEDKAVQKSLTEHPADIIDFIKNVLENSVGLKSGNFESDAFQTVFTVAMVLQALTQNITEKNIMHFKVLINPLSEICRSSPNDELRKLASEIVKVLDGPTSKKLDEPSDVKSEFEVALEDLLDPLLPVRGHALLVLTKLIEKKNKKAMERKQYLLNIFQQNLKNDDSFIYLNAVGGLAALADIFPDTVLQVLCEEYSDFSKKSDEDGHEVRMKLGEVLVRVTKLLGDMAAKYKALLLNTFLVGSKDDDQLIRASSLSNLAEVCRVLGYKLGSIITEVLVCVHAVIATDKSAEARRAAVTVIRQLFVGLDNEVIAFLKEDILPIYRTLKHIYNQDGDDVMRLQAQLALEELNECMKAFVFPKAQLNAEKKVIMLN